MIEKRKGVTAPTYEGPPIKARWFYVLAAAVLTGCSLPCTYHGKAVPRADANRMRALGMDVTCP